MLKTSTLRPGLLVSLKTTMSGNVSYEKNDLEIDHLTKTGAMKARWETVRTVSDPVEHEAAQKARSKAGSIVRSVCSVSAFGLLCPEARAEDLEKAMADARTVIEDFNSKARLTRIGFFLMAGRIAPDDVEAVRAINSEVRDLMKEMQRGIKDLDVQKIRDAANKARGLGQMLTDDAQKRIKLAIDTARSTARAINKAGEQAAQEVDKLAIRKITEQRNAFLDLDHSDTVAVPKAQARSVDLAPTDQVVKKPALPRARLIEREGV